MVMTPPRDTVEIALFNSWPLFGRDLLVQVPSRAPVMFVHCFRKSDLIVMEDSNIDSAVPVGSVLFRILEI